MRASAFAALGLAAYSVFLVATIPARYLAAQLNAALPGRVEVSDASGTLWRGSARARLSPPRGAAIPLDRLEWRFVPARLLSGELAFQAQAGAGGLQGAFEIARGFSSWHVRGAKIDGDASALSAFVPLLATWRPAGAIGLAAEELAIRNREVQGSARVVWRNAIVALSDVRPLGSYEATWRADASGGRIEVTTVNGPLRIVGRGTTTPALRVSFSGEARADASAAQPLEPLLNLMGPRRPDGARALELRLD